MNRHVKRHLEMERLFGADFIPGNKNQESSIKGEPQRETQSGAQRKADYPREFLDFIRDPQET